MAEKVEVEVNFDEAYYVGDETDGVYFDAVQDANGKWHAGAVVDASHFTDALGQFGPFDSFEDACNNAMDAALDWCTENNVVVFDSEIDALRVAIHLDDAFLDMYAPSFGGKQ